MNVGEKCSVTLREASMGKFVNLSGRGSGGGFLPRSALKAVLHFHGIMSACGRADAYVVAAKYAANVLLGILGISGWQFPVISRAFSSPTRCHSMIPSSCFLALSTANVRFHPPSSLPPLRYKIVISTVRGFLEYFSSDRSSGFTKF